MTQHKNIYVALAAAQASMEAVVKGAVNPAFKSRYADLADVVSVVRPPLGIKSDPLTAEQIVAGKRHMARVAMLPCILCGSSPVEVHHCICGRFSQRRASDFEVIPLCVFHHREGPFSIHQNKRLWTATNGNDFEFLALVADLLAGEATL